MNIREAWCRETAHPSYQENWTENNPSYGQCCVTALVMQEIIGGDIYECTIGHRKHFYNVTPDHQMHDFTVEQLSIPRDYTKKVKLRTRESLLRSKDVKERYNLLKTRLSEPTT
jgi:hypothetical protein